MTDEIDGITIPDNPDRSDAVIVRWDPAQGRPRRLRFEPRSDGRWERIEETFTGDHWRPTGSNVLDSLAIEA